MMKNVMVAHVLLVSLLSGVGLSADDAKPQKVEYLATGFAEPPDSARPFSRVPSPDGNIKLL